jgi:hypothetical protein
MIHHVSISANDPKHVASVLAEVMGGRMFPFPGRPVDSFMAMSGDQNGTMIEVYPAPVTLEPGTGDSPVRWGERAKPGYAPFHLLLSVPIDRAAVEKIGAREGWRTRYFGRGAPGAPPVFHVIEFWVENQLMIEIATPDMVGEYTGAMTSERLAAFELQAAH